jgi:Ca-activated chloride channel family protein
MSDRNDYGQPHLTLKLDRPLATDGTTPSHLVATIVAPERDRGEEHDSPPLHLALVIDVSGSMRGAKLEAARQAALEVIEQLRPADRLSLVAFESNVHVHLACETMHASGRTRARAAVAELRSMGTTFLSGGYVVGGELLTEELALQDGHRAHLLLLSDGQANSGECRPEQLGLEAGRLLEAGVPTTCVGFGNDYNAETLEAMAAQGGGRLHHADSDAENAAQLAEILTGELGELVRTACEAAELELEIPENVSVVGLSHAVDQAGRGRLVVKVGSVLKGRPLHVVLQLSSDGPRLLPGIGLGDRCGARLRYRRPGDHEGLSTENAELSLEFAEARDIAPDVALAPMIARVWRAFLVDLITKANRRRDRSEISRIREDDLLRFADYCAYHRETASLPESVERLLREARRPMGENILKQLATHSHKIRYCEDELRKGGLEAHAPSILRDR